jgi:hypothetical protein
MTAAATRGPRTRIAAGFRRLYLHRIERASQCQGIGMRYGRSGEVSIAVRHPDELVAIP